MSISNAELTRETFIELLQTNTGFMIFKFGAEWCAPCNRIKNIVDEWVQKITLRPNISFFYIDIDNSFDLFAYLKSKKIVPGIPALLLFKKGNNSFIPDNVYIGTDTREIDRFFTEL